MGRALRPVIGALAQLDARAVGIVQIMFQQVSNDWNHEAVRAVHTASGEPFFADATYITDLALEKCEGPLFAAANRVSVGAQSRQTAEDFVGDVASTLVRLAARREMS